MNRCASHRRKILNYLTESIPCSLLPRPTRYICSAAGRNYGRPRCGTQSACYDGTLVVSGISGRFPKSQNMNEFRDNLLAGIDMTTNELRGRTDRNPERFGLLQNLESFDADFFGVHSKLAGKMDPQSRILMEVAFEALIDAGINPTEFRGSRTGVFCGAVGGEALDYDNFNLTGDKHGITTLSRTNFCIPGRLSFSLDLRGFSALLSGACASSLMAVEAAINSICLGKCDAAVVTGSSVILNPVTCYDLMDIDALAPDGRCKVFDERGNGYARAEAAVAIIIQKKEDARRRYATVRNVLSSSDGFKFEGIYAPTGKTQEELLRRIYEQANIDPGRVSYIEAHGTGTPRGDQQELPSIHKVFCEEPSRPKPLFVGAVKSNMGHAESAAGLCGLAKALVAIQTGTIPPSINFDTPRETLKPYFDESLQYVTKPTPFDNGIIGISSYGIVGTNSHMIVEPGPVHTHPLAEGHLPVLLPMSGRSEAQVIDSLTAALPQATKNPEHAYLVQKAFGKNIPGFSSRGFGLAQSCESPPEIKTRSISVDQERGVWAIFPGMGSQWNEMGAELMAVEPFAESYRQSRATLKNIGVNADELFRPNNRDIFENLHLGALSIIVMQMALYDTLTALGVKFRGFVGHSMGEFLCAYADGCLNAEETLLVTDARGRAFEDTKKIRGGMASIGLSWEEVEKLLPSGVQLACNNAPNNVTVSGPHESVEKFVHELNAGGEFAVMVNSCGIAAHSEHVYEAADLLNKLLGNIIKGDRLRTPKWITTTVPEVDWEGPLAKYASCEYFDRNLRNPVLFYQALRHVPNESVIVEISPKGFFEAIVKETVPSSCEYIAPMVVKSADRLSHFLSAVGNLYLAGVDVDMDKLYPAVPLPVSADVPFVSPLVKWNHEQTWDPSVIQHPLISRYNSKIDLEGAMYQDIKGHKVEDRIVFPATGYLHLAWRMYADIVEGMHYEKIPVSLSDIQLQRATILYADKPPIIMEANFLPGANKFVISNEGDVVVTGNVSKFTGTPPKLPSRAKFELESGNIPLSTDDIYKEFSLRGYNYSGDFCGIHRIDNEGKWAELYWTGNWTSFLDTVLQTAILSTTARRLALPTKFDRIIIDPQEFIRNLEDPDEDQQCSIVRVAILHHENRIVCPGIEVQGIHMTAVPNKRQLENIAFDKHAFCPFVESSALDLTENVWELVDLVMENTRSKNLEVYDIFTRRENSLANLYNEILKLKPLRESQVTQLTLAGEAKALGEESVYDASVTIVTRQEVDQLVPEGKSDLILLDELDLVRPVADTLKPGGFLLLRTGTDFSAEMQPETPGLSIISAKYLKSQSLVLFKKDEPPPTVVHVPIVGEQFEWIDRLKDAVAKSDDNARIYITSQGAPFSGILGLAKCLSEEHFGERIRCIFDADSHLDLNFSQPDLILSRIIHKDIRITVCRNKTLGSFRHLPLGLLTAQKDTEHAYVRPLTPGDLSSLRWIESPLRERSLRVGSQKEALCKVVYATVNSWDLLLATGATPLEPPLSYGGPYMGFEFSGHDESGRRVMGLTGGKALASSVLVDPRFLWEVPEEWTLEEAATVPAAYATVLQAFQIRARIQPGQSVLIHEGCGGVGQAALSVALALGCTTYTTVGNPEERELIQRLYPKITEDYIGDSRGTSFEQQFLGMTNGKGVDIVLNSLGGDKMMASARCVAENGKFLHVGANDPLQETPIGLQNLLKNMEFHSILPNKYFSSDEDLRRMMIDGIRSGSVRPLTRRIFDKDELEKAYRCMAGGAMGLAKLLIRVRDVSKSLVEPFAISALGRTYFSSEKTYLIVGGLGGFGLEVANWLVERGARYLILTSRSGVTTGYQSLCLRKWREGGVSVETVQVDFSDAAAAETIVKNSCSRHDIGGIFNLAGVLYDGEFEVQSRESFDFVSAPKINTTKYLDEFSRKYCPNLDYFVVFSSSVAGRGNAEQSNYGWANSVTERICERRASEGHHGLAIQWGFINHVGVVAEKMLKGMKNIDNMFGIGGQNVESSLDVLDSALQQREPVLSSIVVAEKSRQKAEEKAMTLTRIAKIFGLKGFDGVSSDKKLMELGMDSLVGKELKQTLERDYNLRLTKEMLLSFTVGDIRAMEAGEFTLDETIEENGTSKA